MGGWEKRGFFAQIKVQSANSPGGGRPSAAGLHIADASGDPEAFAAASAQEPKRAASRTAGRGVALYKCRMQRPRERGQGLVGPRPRQGSIRRARVANGTCAQASVPGQPHKKKKELKEIPVPDVRFVPGYTREYLPLFKIPDTYIKGKGAWMAWPGADPPCSPFMLAMHAMRPTPVRIATVACRAPPATLATLCTARDQAVGVLLGMSCSLANEANRSMQLLREHASHACMHSSEAHDLRAADVSLRQ